LKRTVLVDNSTPVAFLLHIESGIPITDFNATKNQEEDTAIFELAEMFNDLFEIDYGEGLGEEGFDIRDKI
jgi:hypothetical protein